MLTRRHFPTTIAAAPLAKFCKTEQRPAFSYVIPKVVLPKHEVERRYGLPPGILG